MIEDITYNSYLLKNAETLMV